MCPQELGTTKDLLKIEKANSEAAALKLVDEAAINSDLMQQYQALLQQVTARSLFSFINLNRTQLCVTAVSANEGSRERTPEPGSHFVRCQIPWCDVLGVQNSQLLQLYQQERQRNATSNQVNYGVLLKALLSGSLM